MKKTARKPKVKSPGTVSSKMRPVKKKMVKMLSTKQGGAEKPTYMTKGGRRASSKRINKTIKKR